MVEIVSGALFVLMALWFLGDWIRRLRQGVDKAVAKVEADLGRTRSSGQPFAVAVWSAYPLSDHMITHLAWERGYRFVGAARAYNGVRTLTFRAGTTASGGAAR